MFLFLVNCQLRMPANGILALTLTRMSNPDLVEEPCQLEQKATPSLPILLSDKVIKSVKKNVLEQCFRSKSAHVNNLMLESILT